MPSAVNGIYTLLTARPPCLRFVHFILIAEARDLDHALSPSRRLLACLFQRGVVHRCPPTQSDWPRIITRALPHHQSALLKAVSFRAAWKAVPENLEALFLSPQPQPSPVAAERRSCVCACVLLPCCYPVLLILFLGYRRVFIAQAKARETRAAKGVRGCC